ncbi:hypothetical protein D3C84_351230 [compost metagenome]
MGQAIVEAALGAFQIGQEHVALGSQPLGGKRLAVEARPTRLAEQTLGRAKIAHGLLDSGGIPGALGGFDQQFDERGAAMRLQFIGVNALDLTGDFKHALMDLLAPMIKHGARDTRMLSGVSHWRRKLRGRFKHTVMGKHQLLALTQQKTCIDQGLHIMGDLLQLTRQQPVQQ